jgi:hypothetical protein
MVADNTASVRGGGLYVEDVPAPGIQLTGVNFERDRAPSGGAVFWTNLPWSFNFSAASFARASARALDADRLVDPTAPHLPDDVAQRTTRCTGLTLRALSPTSVGRWGRARARSAGWHCR